MLKLSDLAVQVDDVTWPNIRPMNLALSMGLPGGGKIGAKGPVKIEPLDVTLTAHHPRRADRALPRLLPVPGELLGAVQRRQPEPGPHRQRQAHRASPAGNSWATNLAVRGRVPRSAPLRLERMEINGIDFGWPTHARVAKVRLKAPVAELDRATDGSINVQKLFVRRPVGLPSTEPPKPATAPPAASPPAAGPTEKPDLLQTMELYFKEIVVEEGYVRFLDHTTQPPFSQDISKLTVTVKELSNKASQRANVLVQAIIGGDSALDVRGEMSAIGSTATWT